MLSEKSFVRVYAEAEDMERINIIFKHFDNFQRLIDTASSYLTNFLKPPFTFSSRLGISALVFGIVQHSSLYFSFHTLNHLLRNHLLDPKDILPS